MAWAKHTPPGHTVRLLRLASSGLAAALLIVVATPADADGNEFFQSVHTGLKQLVYVGNVRDNHGRLIKGALVTWQAPTDSTDPAYRKVGYSTYTDELGHYRTIDISLIMASMDDVLDTKKIDVWVSLPGYKIIRRFRETPDTQTFGSIELNFVIAPLREPPTMMQRLWTAAQRFWAQAPQPPSRTNRPVRRS